MKTPQQAAQAWVNSAGTAATNWQAGVQAYNGDWAGATTSQQATMASNWNQAVTSGRWAAGVNQAAGTWKQDTIAKAANYSTGFTAGAQNQAVAIQKIMNAEATIVASLPPRGGFQQNTARAVQVMTQLHALKGTLGS